MQVGLNLEQKQQNIMKKGSNSGHEFCQLNHSPSKMSFSFTKQTRFKIPRTDMYSSFYDIPSKLNTRATGFGFGSKSNILLPSLKNPSPNCYSIQSQLVTKQKSKKGNVFGQSRDKVSYGSMLPSNKQKYPGPGEYDLTKSSLTQHNFVMKGQRSESIRKCQRTPGPGQYSFSLLNSSGNTFLSSKKNNRSPKINPFNSRVNTITDSPGPASYQTSYLGIQKGKYIYSKLRDTQKCMFPRTIRREIGNQNKNPGPGSYSMHSEFQ